MILCFNFLCDSIVDLFGVLIKDIILGKYFWHFISRIIDHENKWQINQS